MWRGNNSEKTSENIRNHHTPPPVLFSTPPFDSSDTPRPPTTLYRELGPWQSPFSIPAALAASCVADCRNSSGIDLRQLPCPSSKELRVDPGSKVGGTGVTLCSRPRWCSAGRVLRPLLCTAYCGCRFRLRTPFLYLKRRQQLIPRRRERVSLLSVIAFASPYQAVSVHGSTVVWPHNRHPL